MALASSPMQRRWAAAVLAALFVAFVLGGFLFYDNPRMETEYADLRIGMTMDEVKYVKGYPPYVVEHSKTERPTWWESDPIVMPTNHLKEGQKVEDYRRWMFEIDNHGTRVDVDFDQAKMLAGISCYSQGIMRCPSLIGGYDGMNEKDTIKLLGNPSYEKIDGVTKSIYYKRSGVWFYLTKMKIYLLSVGGFPSVRKAPPCKDGSQECQPWERDWGNTNLNPGATVTNDGTIYQSPAISGRK